MFSRRSARAARRSASPRTRSWRRRSSRRAGWGYLRLRRQDYDDAAVAAWAEKVRGQTLDARRTSSSSTRTRARDRSSPPSSCAASRRHEAQRARPGLDEQPVPRQAAARLHRVAVPAARAAAAAVGRALEVGCGRGEALGLLAPLVRRPRGRGPGSGSAHARACAPPAPGSAARSRRCRPAAVSGRDVRRRLRLRRAAHRCASGSAPSTRSGACSRPGAATTSNG